MLAVGDRFRSRVPLQVMCWWWYDPAAILDDYSDSSDAVLPPGEPFTVEEIPEDEPSRVLCHLDHAKDLQRHLFPHGRQGSLVGGRTTPYLVEFSRDQIESYCDRLCTSPPP